MRRLFEVVLCVLAGMFVAAAPAHAQTVYVNPCLEGAVGAGDGSMTAPYSSLSTALSLAPPGSTLVVHTGTYPETPTLQKNLTINTSNGQALVGHALSTQKICQLTGQKDLFSPGQQDTVNHTEMSYGLSGTDLGASFEHNGRIYFLFGDTIPSVGNSDDNGNRPPNGDSIAWVPADADPEQCLQWATPLPAPTPPLKFLTAANDGKYLSPRVLQGSSILSRAGFEVPTAGFSANGSIYAFFTTDSDRHDIPDCSQETMGRSVLARLDDESQNRFTYLYDVSCRPTDKNCSVPNPGLCRAPPGSAGHFINMSPVVVNNADIPGLPDIADPAGKGLLLWGSGQYRCSDVYLAYVPLNSIESSTRLSWRYAALDAAGQVHWSGCEADATPLLNQAPCVGELSVTWNPFLHKWLMLYNCPYAIFYRVADQPWGPWSEQLTLFDPNCDRGYCHFIHSPNCCMHQAPDCAAGKAKDSLVGDPERPCGPYAPYVISSFTRGDATTTTIYWLLSTWNPYEVVLMKSTLQLDCACRAS